MTAPTTAAEACPALPSFNPLSPEALADLYPAYAHARAQAPIFWSPMLGMWIVTRHQDICEIARDPRRFSSRLAGSAVPALAPEVLAILANGFPDAQVIVNYDPPAHTRVRKLCNTAFTAARVAQLEPNIRELASSLIDDLETAGEAELVQQLTLPLPAMVIGDMLGVRRADIREFIRWSEDWMALLFNPALPLEAQLTGARSQVALQRYCADRIEERRAARRDDFLSDLVHAEVEGESALTTSEIVGVMSSLLVAGHLTSSDLLGSAIVWALRQPGMWDRLRRDPAFAPRMIEEVLRRESSIAGMMRVTAEDVTYDGVSIPAGSRLFLAFGAANHDEAVFPDPARFDVDRDNQSKHIAFGYGAHYCIGAPLARLLLPVALQIVARRLPDLRLAPSEEVTYKPSLVFRGPDRLRVTWGA